MEIREIIKEKITFIEIKEKDFKVILSPLGASIYAIYFGEDILTLSPKNITDFIKDNVYQGKTIGPICGRIPHGELVIDNKTFKFSINEGSNCLHSSKEGLSRITFKYSIKNNKVIFTHKVGLSLKYTITYIINYGEILLKFNVNSSSYTPLALTNHAYFTLGESNIDNLKLKISSSKFLEVNTSDLLPLKVNKLISALDFNKLSSIKEKISDPYLHQDKLNGIDHSLIDVTYPLTLVSKKYTLNIESDYSSIQLYSDGYIDNIEMINIIDKKYRGLAIEPQDNQLERKLFKRYSRFIKYNFISNKNGQTN